MVEELAPELAPMLASIEMPANFVPLTNAVMAEVARGGVGRQQILTALHNMGQELPQASVNMIKARLFCDVTLTIVTDIIHKKQVQPTMMLSKSEFARSTAEQLHNPPLHVLAMRGLGPRHWSIQGLL